MAVPRLLHPPSLGPCLGRIIPGQNAIRWGIGISPNWSNVPSEHVRDVVVSEDNGIGYHEIYPAFSMVQLLHGWALLGREVLGVEVFS